MVEKGLTRKYYRFRPSRFYGGIATADCVGCCLRCVFCWAWNELVRAHEAGEFYTPEEVARRLVKIARRKKYQRVRISGNEPTLAKEHLLRVIELIPHELEFILETNGILIATDPQFADEFRRFPNLYVRISIKGTNEEEFSRLTGAVSDAFNLQLEALRLLSGKGVNCFPAVMVSFSPLENVEELRKRLSAIRREFREFEIEELILYPHVEERLKRRGIGFRTAYRPDELPTDQI